MSLIEEALRKQREETERTQPGAHAAPAPQQGGAGRPAPAPVSTTPPPPLPVQPAASPPGMPAGGDQPEKNRKTWRLLIGLGVLMLIAVAVLAWMFVFGVWLFKVPGTATGTVAAARPPAAGTATQAVVAIPAPVVTAKVAAVTAPITPPAPVVTATVAVAFVAPTPAQLKPPVTPIAPVAVSNPPASTGAVETVKAPIVWPKLTVTGVMGGGRTVRGTVIVNGQMLTLGDAVDGARIVSIDKRGVTLSFSGETRTLAVGTSTE